MLKIKYLKHALALVAVGLVVAGCIGGGSGPTQYGSLKMSMVDAPESSIKQAEISITAVTAHHVDEGWQTIETFDPPLDIDLMELRFVEQILGETNVPVGYYNQIRIATTGDGTITHRDNSTADIFIPSAEFKVNLTSVEDGPFYVGDDGTWIVLDVNMARFVKRGGPQEKYNITPNAIRVVERIQTAAVIGEVRDSAHESLGASVLLSLIPAGEDEPLVETLQYHDEDEFQFNAVPLGTYRLEAAWNDTGESIDLESDDPDWNLEAIEITAVYTMDDPLDLGVLTVNGQD